MNLKKVEEPPNPYEWSVPFGGLSVTWEEPYSVRIHMNTERVEVTINKKKFMLTVEDIRDEAVRLYEADPHKKPCPECNGAGIVRYETPCNACGATGWVE